MPQLRKSVVKAPMFLCGILRRPNFKDAARPENSYQKGVLRGKNS